MGKGIGLTDVSPEMVSPVPRGTRIPPRIMETALPSPGKSPGGGSVGGGPTTGAGSPAGGSRQARGSFVKGPGAFSGPETGAPGAPSGDPGEPGTPTGPSPMASPAPVPPATVTLNPDDGAGGCSSGSTSWTVT